MGSYSKSTCVPLCFPINSKESIQAEYLCRTFLPSSCYLLSVLFFFCLQVFLSGPLLLCLPKLCSCQESHSDRPDLWPPREQEIHTLYFWCEYCGEVTGSLTSSLFKQLRQFVCWWVCILIHQCANRLESSAVSQSEAYPLFFLQSAMTFSVLPISWLWSSVYKQDTTSR